MARRLAAEVVPMRDSKIGHWAFLIGVVLALIAGLVPQLQTPKISWVLVLLGLLVGLLNVTAKETQEFLVATIAFVIAADAAGDLIQLGVVAAVMVGNIVTFVFPASLVVAFKTIWQLASEE
ncbi:hypothetical protein HY489_00650 [Candidatus Woesearchaeota archaeon]|nr:hypothetical protein [Candidatus Woesearchaeota archaeon]